MKWKMSWHNLMLYMASIPDFSDDQDDDSVSGNNGVQPEAKHAMEVF